MLQTSWHRVANGTEWPYKHVGTRDQHIGAAQVGHAHGITVGFMVSVAVRVKDDGFVDKS